MPHTAVIMDRDGIQRSFTSLDVCFFIFCISLQFLAFNFVFSINSLAVLNKLMSACMYVFVCLFAPKRYWKLID